MVKDSHARILMELVNPEKPLEIAAAKAGTSDKAARKCRPLSQLPSRCKAIHDWRTLEDASEGD